MTSLLALKPSPEGCPRYYADAIPYAYEEAGRVQFGAMPGVKWIRDAASPNGRGFYRGPREAIEIVAATLESAGVCKLANTPWRLTPGVISLEYAPQAFDARLREYQRDGAAWVRWMLQRTGAALLADEMGLGKTPQAIAAVESIDGPRLVVCPAVVAPHWQAEIAKWHRPVISEVTDTTITLHSEAWTVLSYEKFSSKWAKNLDEVHAPKWGAAIFDELHYASNPKAKRTKALKAFRAQHPHVPCIGLSGTPMTTRPRDLWQPLDILWPSSWGSAWDFQRRYCNGHTEEITSAAGARALNAEGEPLKPVWVADGISNAEELRTRLAHYMLRRTKAQVGAELPPRTRVIQEVTLPAAARRSLRDASRALDITNARSGVASLLAHSEAYKIDAAEVLAREVMAAGSRPLLLTTRRASAWELARRLGAPAVTGYDAAEDRRAKIADAPAAAATLYSVETGINLTGFDCIIFVGLDWVPSRILQGEARIHRIGQDRPCTIYYLIAKGTVDEIIKDRVIERLEAFEAVTGNSGDGMGLAHDLAPESEEDLIAAIVAAAKGKAA